MVKLNILHITNHPGTILNINQVAIYINTLFESNLDEQKATHAIHATHTLKLDITTHSWKYPYYINKAQSNEIYESFKDIIFKYDILLFTDTPMCARPFLQNLEIHTCGIIIYIPNRFDWGIWGFEDNEFYTLFKNVSLEDARVQFIADNQYDQHYAEYKANIKFVFPECVRLTPYIYSFNTDTQLKDNLPISMDNFNKRFFIQNRGTPITSYNNILNKLEIRYDVYDNNHRYRDKAHICEYLAVLHLPYQVNIQSLMENLGYGIIHFIPSKAFFTDLLNEGWYYWEEKHRMGELFLKSIELAEWYSPELAECFIYFDNWQDLSSKYQYYITSAGQLELLERKQKIITLIHSLNTVNINKWITLFKRFLEKRPTLITMFYNIRKMDDDISDWHRSENTFYKFASEYILKLPIPLVICMEPDNKELASLVQDIRTPLGLLDKTEIHFEKFENTYFHTYIPKLEENKKHYKIYNGNPRHETSRYITLNNNKFHFLEQVMKKNTFQSDRFIWMDMGINHVAQKPFHIFKWLFKIPYQIKQLCINPYLELEAPKELFHNIFHHTAGGLITGSSITLLKYIEYYKAKWVEILEDGWYQIDEAVMTIVQRENRDLFIFYYGDYEGIIANYFEPDLSMNLIMEGANKTIRFNRLDELYAMMQYLIPYFNYEWNQYSGHLYQFIHFNIQCNWYCNKNMLLENTIELINKKIKQGDSNIKNVLENNKDILERYENKNLISSYL